MHSVLSLIQYKQFKTSENERNIAQLEKEIRNLKSQLILTEEERDRSIAERNLALATLKSSDEFQTLLDTNQEIESRLLQTKLLNAKICEEYDYLKDQMSEAKKLLEIKDREVYNITRDIDEVRKQRDEALELYGTPRSNVSSVRSSQDFSAKDLSKYSFNMPRESIRPFNGTFNFNLNPEGRRVPNSLNGSRLESMDSSRISNRSLNTSFDHGVKFE